MKIDARKQRRYVYAVLVSLVMITVAVFMKWPLLKAFTGLFLMVLVLGPLKEIFTTLSIPRIWKEVSVRYYIFDVIFSAQCQPRSLYAWAQRGFFPIRESSVFLFTPVGIFSLDQVFPSVSASWDFSIPMPGSSQAGVS